MSKLVVELRKRPDGVWEKSVPNSSVRKWREWNPLQVSYDVFMKEIKEDRIITIRIVEYSAQQPNLSVANYHL